MGGSEGRWKKLRLIERRRSKDEMPRDDAYDARTSIARVGLEMRVLVVKDVALFWLG